MPDFPIKDVKRLRLETVLEDSVKEETLLLLDHRLEDPNKEIIRLRLVKWLEDPIKEKMEVLNARKKEEAQVVEIKGSVPGSTTDNKDVLHSNVLGRVKSCTFCKC